MDVNKYFDGILEKLEKLSDNEFDQLLLESGIEDCPDDTNYYVTSSFKQEAYKVENKKVVFVDTIKVNNKTYVRFVSNTYEDYNLFNNDTTKAAS